MARYGAYGGLVTRADGSREVFVTGGKWDADTFLTSTEILSLSEPEKGWRSGPSLPFPLYGGSSVQHGDSFLLAGGVDGRSRSPTGAILHFDLEREGFVILPQELSTPRYHAAIFSVPDDFVQC